jgi:heptosyltransferase-2
MRTLVIQTSFLGDMVLTTPLLSRLAASGEVDVLATPGSAPLLANHPAVHETLMYDKRGADAGLRGFARLMKRLRAGRYDRALMAQGSARSGALALAAGIRERVGFDTSAGRPFYTTRVPYIENEHHVARLLRLAGEAGEAGDESALRPRPRLYPGALEQSAVDELLGHAPAGPLVAVAPGSVWPTKRWPYYRDLISTLAARATVVIIGAAGDAAPLDAVAGARHVIDATGKLSLLASAELIGRCRVLVTNDSAPQHLASAMNTPTVAIFGPTVPAFGFGPLAERSTTIGVESLACRPCDRHGPVACPLGHWKCMREVGVAEVIAEVERVG